MSRKLVTIKTIDKILDIKGADRISLAIVGGWSCIIKKGELSVGEKALFFEIDSWIPATDTRFEFLGSTKEYKGRQGWRIKSMKMRKVLSQGLLLPLSTFPELDLSNEDHAETLKVEKWESMEATRTGGVLAGKPKGKFPSFIPKTDQERLQNLPHYFKLHRDTLFEETMKLDGSSITAFKVAAELPWWKRIVNKVVPGYYLEERFGVCSRNLELKPSDDFSKTFDNDGKPSQYNQSDFWATALKYKLDEKVPLGYAVQAELIGPRIQNNHEKVEELELHVYDVYDIEAGKYLNPEERNRMMYKELAGVPHVKVVQPAVRIFQVCEDFDTFQTRVTGVSMNPNTVSEGRVYKSMDGSFSFKLVSNAYLLKEK